MWKKIKEWFWCEPIEKGLFSEISEMVDNHTHMHHTTNGINSKPISDECLLSYNYDDIAYITKKEMQEFIDEILVNYQVQEGENTVRPIMEVLRSLNKRIEQLENIVLGDGTIILK